MKRTLLALIALATLLTACQAVPTEDAQEVAEPIAEIENYTEPVEPASQVLSWQEVYVALLLEYKEESEDLFFVLHDFDKSGIPELVVVGGFEDIPWYDAVYAFRSGDAVALEIGDGVHIGGPVLSARKSGITNTSGNEPGLITYFVGVGSLFGASTYYSRIVVENDKLIVDNMGVHFVDVATLNDIFEELRESLATGGGQHLDWDRMDAVIEEHTHFLIQNRPAVNDCINVLLNTSEDITHILNNHAVSEDYFFSIFGREESLSYYRVTEESIREIIFVWYDNLEISDTDAAPIDFAELLITHSDLLLSDIDAITLPHGYVFQPQMNAVGDLTGNGLDDLAIVITEYV